LVVCDTEKPKDIFQKKLL